MSRMIETLHRGHRGHRPHLAAHSRAARRRQLVGAARPPEFSIQADGSPGSLAAARPRRSTQAAPLTAGAQFLNVDDHAVAACKRILRQLYRELDLSEPRCVCLTSSSPGEGKTTTAINLAFAAAQQAERRVIVVDVNLARPQIAHRLGIQPKLGLSDLLVEGLFPSEVISEVSLGGFDVLSTGRIDRRAPELLNSRRMDVLLWDLKQSYDLIIVDAPHVRDQTAATILGLDFDAVYLVLRMFETRRESVDKALGLLHSAGVTVRGCILTHDGALSDDLSDANDLEANEVPASSSAPAILLERTPNPLIAAAPVPRTSTSQAAPCVIEHEPTMTILTTPTNGSMPDPFEMVAVDTLEKLETICPFDHASPVAVDARAEPRHCDAFEPDVVSALESSVHSILVQPPAVATVIAPPVPVPPSEIPEQPFSRRFRVHPPAPPSIESGEPDPNPVELTGECPEITNESWAANVLAVCGGLLMLAGILFVAVDAAFWL